MNRHGLYGGLLILFFPIGTPFGLFLLVYALSHRRQFAPLAPLPS